MKQFAEHDKVGICHSLRRDDMYRRVFSGGYPYLMNGAITRSSSSQPIYSYGKNYSKDDSNFALFVWTTEDNQDVVEQLFEDSLERITDEQIVQVVDDGSFVYVD